MERSTRRESFPGWGEWVIVENGVFEMVVTYLEMLERPDRFRVPSPREGFSLRRIRAPSVPFYRELYRSVGEKWYWADRCKMDDEALRNIIHDPRVEIHVLFADQRPAGYAELDMRQSPDIELTYLGIIPECIGMGLGRFLLSNAIDLCWKRETRRLWLHTCSLDHPRALSFYEKAGFRIYRREVRMVHSREFTAVGNGCG